jgi:putative flavoprotein involved in K+ transport
MVVLGLPFMRRRKSSFIHGAEDDVRELAAHLLAHLQRRSDMPAAARAGARPHRQEPRYASACAAGT